MARIRLKPLPLKSIVSLWYNNCTCYYDMKGDDDYVMEMFCMRVYARG